MVTVKTLAAIMLLSVPLSAASGRPAWLSGKTGDYPRSRYLIGIGTGDGREQASDKARSEIAKTFSLSLTAETKTSASETSSNGASSYSQDISDDVRTYTKKEIEGLSIVRHWKDPEGIHYALAVLERAPALARLQDRLEELDVRFEGLAEELDAAEGRFERLRPALRLQALARSRRRLNSDYRFMNPKGKGLRAPKTSRAILRAARKAVSAIRIRVEGSAVVVGRVVESLEETGLKAFTGGEDEDILVRIKARARLLEPENLLWYWAKGSVKVTMSRGSTGEVFKRFTEEAQVAAREPRRAYEATLQSLADKASLTVFMTVSSAPLLDD